MEQEYGTWWEDEKGRSEKIKKMRNVRAKMRRKTHRRQERKRNNINIDVRGKMSRKTHRRQGKKD